MQHGRSSTARRAGGAVALVVALGTLAGCGGDDADRTAAEPADATTAAPTTVPVPERCDWDLNTAGFWAQEPPTEPLAEHQHASEAHAQGNEHGVQAWVPMDDAAECAALAEQIDAMEQVASRYPTLRDATDAGCFMATTYIPGIAAHLYCVSNHQAGTDIEHPTMLLYGGNKPEAPIVGLSYMVYTEDAPSDAPDADLWVRYMPWHFHEGLCIKNGLVIGGDNSDAARCEAAGGRVQGRTGWMGHYWLPTCPSPDGVFSAANPRLDAAVGQYNDAHAGAPGLVETPCAGSGMPIEPEGGDRFGRPEGMDPHWGLGHGDHAGAEHDMDHAEHDMEHTESTGRGSQGHH